MNTYFIVKKKNIFKHYDVIIIEIPLIFADLNGILRIYLAYVSMLIGKVLEHNMFTWTLVTFFYYFYQLWSHNRGKIRYIQAILLE